MVQRTANCRALPLGGLTLVNLIRHHRLQASLHREFTVRWLLHSTHSLDHSDPRRQGSVSDLTYLISRSQSQSIRSGVISSFPDPAAWHEASRRLLTSSLCLTSTNSPSVMVTTSRLT
jgi:hypothetical protein